MFVLSFAHAWLPRPFDVEDSMVDGVVCRQALLEHVPREVVLQPCVVVRAPKRCPRRRCRRRRHVRHGVYLCQHLAPDSSQQGGWWRSCRRVTARSYLRGVEGRAGSRLPVRCHCHRREHASVKRASPPERACSEQEPRRRRRGGGHGAFLFEEERGRDEEGRGGEREGREG